MKTKAYNLKKLSVYKTKLLNEKFESICMEIQKDIPVRIQQDKERQKKTMDLAKSMYF